MDKLFLIDGHALVYRSYYALIKKPRVTSKGLNTSAIMGFVNTLREILMKERPTHIGAAFDPNGPTFRHKIYADYKAQREACPEDIKISIPIIKEILSACRIPVYEEKGYEADDVIGTLATKASERGIDTYMLTPDKDYAQLVKPHVFMYRLRHGNTGYEVLGEREVMEKYGIPSPIRMIDLLGLMGDASDNIPGCRGVGEKTAMKLLSRFGSIEDVLANTAELSGVLRKNVETDKENIMLSKYLATIRTDVPVALDMEALSVKDPDEKKLREIFDELEFKNLADRILGKSERRPVQPIVQLSLFDENPAVDEGTASRLNLDSIKTTPHNYQLVDSEADMTRLCEQIITKDFLSLDTETTSVNAIDAELVGLSFSVKEGEAYYVPVPSGHDEAMRVLSIFKPIYEDEKIMKIGQNIKYDIEVLHNYGITVRGELFDTMIAHYVIQPELRHNMDYLAEVYLHYQTIHIDELIGPRGKTQKNMRDLSPEAICDYSAEDADITLRLKNVLVRELDKYGATRLFREIEMPLIPVLAQMETDGVRLDTRSLHDTSIILTNRMKEIEHSIYKRAGESFNISSPKQVGEILFDKLHIMDKAKKTRSGQYITSEEVLQTLKGKNAIVSDILSYRGVKKLLGTYIEALPKLVNTRTRHIHTSFNQAITATGRLSSSNPNLQNIPIRGEDGKEIRKAFVPEEGCLFFSADYSQIELRVMAHLSGDKNMTEAFLAGHDIHASTAAKIYKTSIENITRDQRTKAKRANFGIIYGITVFGLAERLEISREEARQLIDGYFATYPQVYEYMEASKSSARSKGYVETLFGRRRYLPEINSRNATVRGFAERNAINAPIQGTAADIIKIAMTRIHKRFKEEGIRSKMILQVHDELNFSVLPEERERVERIVLDAMEGACALSVPLVVDSGWGDNWLEAH